MAASAILLVDDGQDTCASLSDIIPALNRASAQPATPTRPPQPSLQELAEGCLRRNPYLALRNVSCDCREGVLVLRGCLPTYYLKQVAQQAVAHLEGVKGVENQIQVVPGASRSGQS
jgi:hypothetical protein